MALPNVAQGDPHVQAHNAERQMLNGLEAVTNTTFRTALGTFVDDRVPDNLVTSTTVTSIVTLTQTQYDALATKSPTTAYLILSEA